jgi:hypothetical protein
LPGFITAQVGEGRDTMKGRAEERRGLKIQMPARRLPREETGQEE